MFDKNFYKGKTEEEIKKEIEKEGFNPIPITNEPEYVYQQHQHPETKLLVFLKGSMELAFGGKTYLCEQFDKVIVPGNTLHSAVVGPQGCTFFWSEKLI